MKIKKKNKNTATRFAGKHPVDVFFLSGLAAPAACSPGLRSHGGRSEPTAAMERQSDRQLTHPVQQATDGKTPRTRPPTHRSDIAKHPKAAAPTRTRVEPRQSHLPHS